MTAGYSKRPLVDKLGIKSGMRVCLLNAPEGYADLLGGLPPGVEQVETLDAPCDFIQCFVSTRVELGEAFPRLEAALKQDGMIWISWRKGGAKANTDLNENIVRDVGLAIGLVDVKVIAVDAIWSGLKFVYRLKDRG